MCRQNKMYFSRRISCIKTIFQLYLHFSFRMPMLNTYYETQTGDSYVFLFEYNQLQ